MFIKRFIKRHRFIRTLQNPIAQKIVMAATGLFLVTFLVVHLGGNLLLLAHTPAPFNAYAAFMEHNFLVRILEMALFSGFILHIAYAAVLTYKNKRARPIQYAAYQPAPGSTLFSRTMGVSGSIVFIFLAVHLNTFFVPERVMHSTTATLHDIAVTAFANPAYTGFYVIAMILLGFHLNHGFQSAFQTLGLQNRRYSPLIRMVGTVFAFVVPGLFALIPAILYFTRS